MYQLILIALSVSAILINGCTNETPINPTIDDPETTKTQLPNIEPSVMPTTDMSNPEEATITPTQLVNTSNIQLSFVSDRSGNSAIYSMDVDCWDSDVICFGEPVMLMEWNKRISELDWSPNGERVVFASDGNLYMSEWNGSNIFKIPSDPGSESFPQWSTDGSKIAYIFGSDIDPGQIRIFDIETGQTIRILENVFDPSRVLWLDGDILAYIATDPKTATNIIIVGKPDGTIIQQMPENASDFLAIFGLDFSPDGSNLTFVGEIQLGEPDIYVIDETKSVVNITKGKGINLGPVWSPKGNWIAFQSMRDGNYQIYIAEIGSTYLQQVTQPPSQNTDPSWRYITN